MNTLIPRSLITAWKTCALPGDASKCHGGSGIPRRMSILQWQLTANYSVLAGGGIFGNEGPLQPTQRYWNLKQLGSTPAGAYPRDTQGSYAKYIIQSDLATKKWTQREVIVPGLTSCFHTQPGIYIPGLSAS